MRRVLTFCLLGSLSLSTYAQEPAKVTVNTDGMAMISGGSFDMGIDTADTAKLQQKFGIKRTEMFEDQMPKHRVTIGTFYLDKTEVTNAQFKNFVEQHPEWQKAKISPAYHNGKYLQHWNGNDVPKELETYPVVFVSWYAAAAYCKALGKRLPTEAEWEFAARGGLAAKGFPWGDEMPDKSRANYGASGLNSAAAVASYPANGYGLFDMAGNVWEYLADEWQKYTPNATNGSAAADIFNNRSYLQVKTRRALRGGSYGGAPINMLVTYRDSHSPENAVEHVGFRCAMTAPVQSAAVDELLRLHHEARASHFMRDARSMVAGFSDDFTNVSNGRISMPARESSQTRLQKYFDSSTFLEWDDITPPMIRISNDATMGYVVVHKRVRLRSKQPDGKEAEEAEVFAWVSVYQKVKGEWKLALVASTNTPEAEQIGVSK